MHSKTLYSPLLSSEPNKSEKNFVERLVADRFNQIVSTQTWSDPETDLYALQLKPGASIVSFCSGGCNALAYLSAQPAVIYTVHDSNAQLAMLEIKAKAIKHLPDYQAVLHFLGNANGVDNQKRYQRHIRKNLSEPASLYWQKRSLLGSPRYYAFSQNAYQRSPLGRLIYLTHALIKFQGRDLSALLSAKNRAEQIHYFEIELAPFFESKLFKLIANQTLLLACLGLSLSQIKRIKEDAKEGIHHFIKDKIKRLTCDFDLNKNCFAQLAFAAQYDTNTQEKLPMYLQEKFFAILRQNTHRILSQKSSMTQFLQSQTDGSINAFVLNDIQDRLNKTEILALWTEINRTATSGAKVLFRSITSNLNIEQQLSPTLLDHWKTDKNLNTQLLQSDRSAIYNSIRLYTKNS